MTSFLVLNKYSLSYLILYSSFSILFLKEGPKNYIKLHAQINLDPPLITTQKFAFLLHIL